MEIATTTTKEEEMFGMTYVVRVDFSDGFEIVNFEAGSIVEALGLASKMEGAESVMLVGTIDRKPQEVLAW